MYATSGDMQARFGEVELIGLTDRDGTGAIDSQVLDGALGDAGATIDGFLAARYPLPLVTVPLVLTRLACDLARYYLYDEQATEQVSKRHDDALKLLAQFANGTVTLGLTDTEVPTSSNTCEVQSAGSVWGRATSKGFV